MQQLSVNYRYIFFGRTHVPASVDPEGIKIIDNIPSASITTYRC